MFQNESYAHELTFLPTPIQENVGSTLSYFSLHPNGDAKTSLAHLTLYLSYTMCCLGVTM